MRIKDGALRCRKRYIGEPCKKGRELHMQDHVIPGFVRREHCRCCNEERKYPSATRSERDSGLSLMLVDIGSTLRIRLLLYRLYPAPNADASIV